MIETQTILLTQTESRQLLELVQGCERLNDRAEIYCMIHQTSCIKACRLPNVPELSAIPIERDNNELTNELAHERR